MEALFEKPYSMESQRTQSQSCKSTSGGILPSRETQIVQPYWAKTKQYTAEILQVRNGSFLWQTTRVQSKHCFLVRIPDVQKHYIKNQYLFTQLTFAIFYLLSPTIR